jgi:hypothetical protein
MLPCMYAGVQQRPAGCVALPTKYITLLCNLHQCYDTTSTNQSAGVSRVAGGQVVPLPGRCAGCKGRAMSALSCT